MPPTPTPSTLAEGEVHVWFARPPLLDVERLAPWLSDDERLRASRFHFERNRREHIATRALVRTTLSRYQAVAPSAWIWKLGEFGKPSIDPPSGLHFNASNHPELVVCGVSLAPELGVDVEPFTSGEQILQVASEVFSPPEREGLFALVGQARLDRAVSLWTAKEAYVKARGLGLSAPLQEIIIDVPEGRPVLRFSSPIDTPTGWALEHVDVHGFRLAIAVRCGANPPRVIVREASIPLASDPVTRAGGPHAPWSPTPAAVGSTTPEMNVGGSK